MLLHRSPEKSGFLRNQTAETEGILYYTGTAPACVTTGDHVTLPIISPLRFYDSGPNVEKYCEILYKRNITSVITILGIKYHVVLLVEKKHVQFWVLIVGYLACSYLFKHILNYAVCV